MCAPPVDGGMPGPARAARRGPTSGPGAARHARGRTGLPSVLLAAALVATGVPPGTRAASSAGVAAPGGSPASAVGAQADPADGGVDALIRFVSGGSSPARSELDRVWRPILESSALELRAAYAPPVAVVGYAGGTMPATACSPGTSVRYWRQNARYCPDDHAIWYDDAWLGELAERFGAYAPAAVLAHEWGHHVQALVGGTRPGIRAELEADCFAGMYLGETEGVTPDGQAFTISVDRLWAAIGTFFSLGDREYRESDWFQPQVHGSPEQRMLAFATGYLSETGGLPAVGHVANGLDWCLGYGDFRPRAYTAIGPYQLLGPPGRPGAWDGDVYVIPPRRPSAYPAGDIRLRWVPGSAMPAGRDPDVLLARLLDAWLPGATLPFGAVAFPPGTPGGAAVAGYVQVRRDGTLAEGQAALLLPSAVDGALIVLVGASPRTDGAVSGPDTTGVALMAEQVFSLGAIVMRLCGPDEVADAAGEQTYYACLFDRQ